MKGGGSEPSGCCISPRSALDMGALVISSRTMHKARARHASYYAAFLGASCLLLLITYVGLCCLILLGLGYLHP